MEGTSVTSRNPREDKIQWVTLGPKEKGKGTVKTSEWRPQGTSDPKILALVDSERKAADARREALAKEGEPAPHYHNQTRSDLLNFVVITERPNGTVGYSGVPRHPSTYPPAATATSVTQQAYPAATTRCHITLAPVVLIALGVLLLPVLLDPSRCLNALNNVWRQLSGVRIPV